MLSPVQSDELSLQKKLRTEVIQLEDTLAQVRKEYEMLRIEFEQNLAANEQAGTFQNTPSHLLWNMPKLQFVQSKLSLDLKRNSHVYSITVVFV